MLVVGMAAFHIDRSERSCAQRERGAQQLLRLLEIDEGVIAGYAVLRIVVNHANAYTILAEEVRGARGVTDTVEERIALLAARCVVIVRAAIEAIEMQRESTEPSIEQRRTLSC